MGYACPVCEDPQSDATHLANHLAFTAMLRGGEHGEWLDDHVPGWGNLDETELGERVADHAETVEFPQVFEDTTDRGPGHEHTGGHTAHTDSGDLPAGAEALEGETVDEAAREAIAEAREMTRKRRERADISETDGETGPDTGGGDDGTGAETE
ncbi:MAG: hypothetical protein ACI9CA_000357 [Natronomonas sp.]|jgi:hypothetical protein